MRKDVGTRWRADVIPTGGERRNLTATRLAEPVRIMLLKANKRLIIAVMAIRLPWRVLVREHGTARVWDAGTGHWSCCQPTCTLLPCPSRPWR